MDYGEEKKRGLSEFEYKQLDINKKYLRKFDFSSAKIPVDDTVFVFKIDPSKLSTIPKSGHADKVHLFKHPDDPSPIPLVGPIAKVELELEGSSILYLYAPPGIAVDVEVKRKSHIPKLKGVEEANENDAKIHAHALMKLAEKALTAAKDELAFKHKKRRSAKITESKISVNARKARKNYDVALKDFIEYYRLDDLLKDFHIGLDPNFLASFLQAVQVGVSEDTVLIHGETGSGKDIFSKVIHRVSSKREKKYQEKKLEKKYEDICIAMNCSAYGGDSDILTSQLFGHVKEAFTGAVEDKDGLINEAEGGTLFLDEIGDAPEIFQRKLLRTIEDRKFRKFGGTKEIPFDVRFVCASNKDLKDTEGFRKDLYHRLAQYFIYVPPIRERKDKEEIIIARASKTIVAHGPYGFSNVHLTEEMKIHLSKVVALCGFGLGDAEQINPTEIEIPLDKVLSKLDREGKKNGGKAIKVLRYPTVTEEYIAKISSLRLDGNYRELKNIISQTITDRKFLDVVTREDVQKTVGSRSRQSNRIESKKKFVSDACDYFEGEGNFEDKKDELSQLVYAEALRRNNDNSKQAAASIGVSGRTISDHIKKQEKLKQK